MARTALIQLLDLRLPDDEEPGKSTRLDLLFAHCHPSLSEETRTKRGLVYQVDCKFSSLFHLYEAFEATAS